MSYENYESVGGIGFVVSASKELMNTIKQKDPTDDFFTFLEIITDDTDFVPIYFRNCSCSVMEYAVVHSKKSFKEIVSSFEQSEKELYEFLKNHGVTIESEFEMIFGLFGY